MFKLEKNKINSEGYIDELEGKIVDLSIKLKGVKNELNSVRELHKKTIGKLVHNLKNPIGVIFSFSDMMMEDLEDYSKEKLEKHLRVINNSAHFSLQMLTTVAKYTQLQAPDLTYTLETLNYIELINNIAKEFDGVAKEKNSTIEKKFPETPVLLTVDENEISLAIRNIIHNAFRYSNENSVIKITVEDTEKNIETTISDEGIGISEENLPAIFNEFFVVNTYSADKQKCIGLGLSIANKIIEDHHGKILVTSTLNKGSNFKIILPKK